MSSAVISISNQKGGTGKTTLTMNLAAGLARRGRTLVVDADPQGSALQWAGLSSDEKPFPVSVIAVADNLGREVGRFAEDYQYVLIDCPPTLETEVTRAAMRIADTVLIPTLPSPVDLWASLRLANAIEEVKLRNPRLAAYILVNQLEPRSALSQGMKQALEEFDIPALNSHLRRRAIYRNAALEGLSVYCMGKRGEPAAAEIDAIIEEVL
ncbi:cobyrinic acid a,c-diamide synthase [Candidatus Tenderia electrophaga]|jgi:chromosome partitioning protein|uniref:Cobyrinic acid a,c-diamide synthase n=1 Tax=Candidatus Tenderia electrophaga TaxID=1748243 RepID=A0A0S2TCJ3_9GAMM|nr:cobyrinic acid a,c-diamide synthase [Candidatus Tenderia electrophaga]